MAPEPDLVYRRSPEDRWSRAVTVAELRRVASRRLIAGHGRFKIALEGTPLASELRRKDAVTRIERLISSAGFHLGEIARIRDAEDRVVFAFMRIDPTTTEDVIRHTVVDDARWMIAHNVRIGYSQARPFKRYGRRTVPMVLDCSGSAITLAHWAGAQDPSGLDFSGYGNSSTIAAHAKQIARSRIAPGDLVVFGINPTVHVAVIIQTGADPLCFSHGQPAGPIAIRLSSESRYHAGQALRFFTLVP